MPAPGIQQIVIIGAGRLATHLGLAFHKVGLKVVQVYNRTPGNGRKLAHRLDASFTSDIEGIHQDADLYILAVADSVIGFLAGRLHLGNRLVVHVSGTMEMKILEPVSSRIGVFYPLQTFTHNRRINFRNVPVCIEGSSDEVELILASIAGILTEKVHTLDTAQRQVLHLGAVFASNFTNYIYAMTEELLTQHDIPLQLLEPLILQTARNVKHGNLSSYQTGPAMRGDVRVLEKHYEMLASRPDFLKIYKLMSENIINQTRLHGKL